MRSFVYALTLVGALALAAQNPQQSTPSRNQQSTTAATQSQTGGGITTDAVPVIPGRQQIEGGTKGPARIAREVRHELAMLPYYTLFDDLRFRVNGTTVELLGDVNNPSLKSDAERAVKQIEGVEQVVNRINLLSPSPADDRIRQATARAVFGAAGLSRYSWEASPSIHIIVNNGRVRLVGIVDNASDKQIAGVQANSVPGVISVSNELMVQDRR